MGTTIAALSSSSIRHSEFVRITMPSQTVTFCSAAAPITVNGITFTGLGDLMNISDIQRDIKATGADMTVSLTGIDGSNVGMILGSEIKGATVEVWRGFFDSNNQIIQTPTQQFFKRYQGIVNNVSISEDFDEKLRTRVATCSVSCASIRMVLENRIAGIKTNDVSWKSIYPGDASMNRVATIVAQYFDFGKKPKKGSQSSATASSNADTLDS